MLKDSKMIGHFVGDQESSYYQSERFAGIIKFVQKNPSKTRLRESKNKLTLVISSVRNVIEALEILRSI